MTMRIGARIWIPCEVKEGPFSDERIVRVQSGLGESLAFVRVEHLQEPILKGSTFVRAVVTAVQADKFIAQLPGREIDSKEFEGELSKVAVG